MEIQSISDMEKKSLFDDKILMDPYWYYKIVFIAFFVIKTRIIQ